MKIPPITRPLDEVRRELDAVRTPLRIAVLRAKNPFNVGAIIRVAHSFLVREIVLVGDEPYYQRAAMGMDRYENLVHLPDEPALISWARERKLPLVVLEREQARETLWDCHLPAECVLVFGSEDFGVGPALLEAADQLVAIPMHGINHSFPLSIAAGITMAEWSRRYLR